LKSTRTKNDYLLNLAKKTDGRSAVNSTNDTTTMRWLRVAAVIATTNGLRPSFDPIGLAARDASPITNLSPVRQPSRETTAIVSAAALATTLLPEAAYAKGGEFGLAEGRIISLAHPVAMGGCFLVSGSAW
jgi:hypothetical protein